MPDAPDRDFTLTYWAVLILEALIVLALVALGRAIS